jgi:hypothetical protein
VESEGGLSTNELADFSFWDILLAKEHADSWLAADDLHFIAVCTREDRCGRSRSNGAVSPPPDHDGLSDALEQALSVQFAPTFMVGRAECSNIPAEFRPEKTKPEATAHSRFSY